MGGQRSHLRKIFQDRGAKNSRIYLGNRSRTYSRFRNRFMKDREGEKKRKRERQKKKLMKRKRKLEEREREEEEVRGRERRGIRLDIR